MDLGLGGRVIIVTGAASGVGKAVAGVMAGEGARLVLADRDAEGLARVVDGLRLSGAEVAGIVADLETMAGVEAVIAGALARFGRIEGLVNNAASVARGALVDAAPAFFDAMFALNVRAPFFLMQGAVRDMLARGEGGAIVNILSVNARVGLPTLAVYAATKGAMTTLTRNAAHAHLAERVRVNGINLGWTLTEGEDRLQRELVGEDWLERVAPTLPLGRLVSPEDCARAVAWLLSDCSAPQTGTVHDLEQKVSGAP
jgi:NAD(P)-dependent dehydrogenase (short-subunit alcohol dehydrogenase family)